MNRSIAVLFLLLLFPAARPPHLVAQAADQLAPRAYAALPGSLDDLWLVPRGNRGLRSNAFQALTEAVTVYGAGDYARALSLVSRPALAGSELRDYAAYYKGLCELKLSRAADARATFAVVRKRNPRGYVAIAAALGEAEAAEALGDAAAAVNVYAKLAGDKTTISEEILSKQGRAALAVGDRKSAAEAFLRVYYEFALTDAAIAAAEQLESLRDLIVRKDYKADLGRAAILFGARRYADARAAFAAIQGEVSGDDRELVDLRIAESDYFLKHHQAALDRLRPWLDRGARRAEARFYYLSALRDLGRHDESIAQTHALVHDFPDSSWSEEALNNVGTHYILTNEEALAAQVFRELHQKFPTGPRAERAAWKSGWWSYKNAEYAETVRVFENAAASFARSDYRPSFLYWAARAHGKLGAGSQAESRMRLVFTDYGNSYYGRLADRQLPRHARAPLPAEAIPASHAAVAADATPPPTAGLIRLLLANQLWDDALNELRFAQRVWGSSRSLEATTAWAYYQKGELRRAITLMRRAYPQHLSAGGQELPVEILQVIFPLTYWDSIRKYSAARKLDPYLIAALIAQESTFDPKIRSSANAWGLMQVLPSTGRRLARQLGIRRFSTSMLTDPDINLRMGTLYFSRLVAQFGGTHYALASYNAGENRVVRWKAERPGLDQDEFIDDIPFPETQNYVKRILGTAEDYRRLYGKAGGQPIPVARAGTRAGSS